MFVLTRLLKYNVLTIYIKLNKHLELRFLTDI